ncbi:hypothetical protein OAP50_01250 [bacterium]|nr:hypothetical protein [bacterium]
MNPPTITETFSTRKVLCRWYSGEINNFEYFHQGLWFGVIDFNFEFNGKRQVKLKPINPSDYGAEKWAEESIMIPYDDVDNFFTVAKMMLIWEDNYLMLNYDLES